ncbi:unnamed protein product [Protopolystoma xenopodis]|uniref:RRM domain-containing protein n=1 Tax=Protopolystoma xenopodis TaxID=117903 RepID=A0A448X1Z8_9PLAT|nr:unnamed protein product [Protopolystoma xenopodis]
MECDRTLFVTNFCREVTEELFFELFNQSGPVQSVNIKGNVAFVTYEDEESIIYSCALFKDIKLYGKRLQIKPRKGSKYEQAVIPSVPPYMHIVDRVQAQRSSYRLDMPNFPPSPIPYSIHPGNSEHFMRHFYSPSLSMPDLHDHYGHPFSSSKTGDHHTSLGGHQRSNYRQDI